MNERFDHHSYEAIQLSSCFNGIWTHDLRVTGACDALPAELVKLWVWLSARERNESTNMKIWDDWYIKRRITEWMKDAIISIMKQFEPVGKH